MVGKEEIKERLEEEPINLGGIACDGCPKELSCDFKTCDQ
jgi:hypothetical protein